MYSFSTFDSRAIIYKTLRENIYTDSSRFTGFYVDANDLKKQILSYYVLEMDITF